jgi:hypothetical protein
VKHITDKLIFFSLMVVVGWLASRNKKPEADDDLAHANAAKANETLKAAGPPGWR